LLPDPGSYQTLFAASMVKALVATGVLLGPGCVS
jgi:hypothetical protein